MTENEKKLLKTNNKRKIKEVNNMNTDKEQLEMIEAVLNLAKETVTEEEMDDYRKEKNETILKYAKKNNVILSDVPEFKVRQLWNIFNTEIFILKEDFYNLKKNALKLKQFQHYAKDISYIIDELCYSFDDLANKKSEKENYHDVISEYNYEELTTEKLFLKHRFFDCKNYDSYLISVEESFELFSFIKKYIEDAINDMTKEKCTTASNIFMIVSVETEGLYVCHFEK